MDKCGPGRPGMTSAVVVRHFFAKCYRRDMFGYTWNRLPCFRFRRLPAQHPLRIMRRSVYTIVGLASLTFLLYKQIPNTWSDRGADSASLKFTYLHIIRKGKVMKVLSLALLLMASVAFVLLGCSDNSGPVGAPTDQALSTGASSGALAKGCVVVGSVVGAGTFATPDPSTFFSSVKFEFTAMKYSDGTCRGEFAMTLVGLGEGKGTKIYGNVKGIKFYGNVAMFWGELRSEFLVDVFGKASWRQIFVVTDNGQGKKRVPDRMSNPWLTSEELSPPGEFETYWAKSAEDFLASISSDLGTPPDYPLARGNIQVCQKKQ